MPPSSRRSRYSTLAIERRRRSIESLCCRSSSVSLSTRATSAYSVIPTTKVRRARFKQVAQTYQSRAHRGLRQADPIPCPCDGALREDGVKDFQQIEVDCSEVVRHFDLYCPPVLRTGP